MTLLGWILACTSGPDRPVPIRPVPTPSPPTVPTPAPTTGGWQVSLSPAPAEAARRLEVTAPVAVDLRVTFTDALGQRTLTFPDRAATRAVTLVGFRPGATTLALAGTAADGATFTAGPIELEVPEPPPEFPIVEVVALDADRAEPGWTLLDVAGPGDEVLSWAVLLDEGYRPIWWTHYPGGGLQDVELRPDGMLRAIGLQEGSLVTLSLAGEVVEALLPGVGPLAEVHSAHHEVVWQDDGGFVLLDQASVTVDAFPSDYAEPTTLSGPTAIADTRVRFFDPGQTLVDTWSAAEHLQTTRIGMHSLNPTQLGYDWAHGNALTPDGDGWLLSMRHQDAIARFGPDGAVDWILGTPSGWSAPWDALLLAPIGPVTWPHHQHGLHVAGDELTLFDNRTETRTPYDAVEQPPRWARAVRYRIDPVARTVEEVWSASDTAVGPLEVTMIGDAQPLPETGGVLATFGFVEGERGVVNADRGWGEVTAHLVEYAGDGSVVAHVRLRSDAVPPTELGYRVYRAARIPTAWPGQATWQ